MESKPKNQNPLVNKPSKPEVKVHRIDASGKVLGRLSTEVADLLRGKDKVEFLPNILIGDKVIIFNASKFVVTGKKMEQKMYYSHSGYIGNLKSQSMKELFAKNPSEIVLRSIKGMLPKNKLQDQWLKNLEIYNNEIMAK